MVNSYFADSYIDSNDYLSPNKENIRSDSMLFNNPDYSSVLYISHKTSTASRDKGWLSEDRSDVSNIKIVSYIPDAVPSTKSSLGYNILFQIVLYADHTNTITYIKYAKIQDVLANLGGVITFFRFLWIIVFSITNYFDISFDLYCYTYLNDKTYTIKSSVEQNLSRNNTKRDMTITIRSNKPIDPQTNDQSPSSIKSQKILLKTGFCKYFCSRISGNLKDHRKYEIIHDKIRKELEVSSYLRMKEDMTLMKIIFFGKEERQIFNQLIDFRDVTRIFKDNVGSQEELYEEYLRSSYQKVKLPKCANYSLMNDIITKLKAKFRDKKELSNNSANKASAIRENNYMKHNI